MAMKRGMVSDLYGYVRRIQNEFIQKAIFAKLDKNRDTNKPLSAQEKEDILEGLYGGLQCHTMTQEKYGTNTKDFDYELFSEFTKEKDIDDAAFAEVHT